MRLATVAAGGRSFIAARHSGSFVDLSRADPRLPSNIAALLAGGAEAFQAVSRAVANAKASEVVDPSTVAFLPVVPCPGKILCAGLNYREHAAETGLDLPTYPAFFARFPSSLVGHGAPLVRPLISEQLDFEGEFAVIIGRAGRHIDRVDALGHVAGYALFNDASIRDYQMKSSQWTIGKNFDGTGAFGPDFVSADELPPGLLGLRLTTKLNGKVMQETLADDMIFDVAELISTISNAMTLEPGDVIITGTPSGVGLARKPPVWMRPGDIVTVEADQIGLLSNSIADEARPAHAQ